MVVVQSLQRSRALRKDAVGADASQAEATTGYRQQDDQPEQL